VIDRLAFRPETLARAGLVLTATGIASASSVWHALDESYDLSFVFGFLFYVGLILIASARRQLAAAPIIAFAAFAVTYIGATFSTGGDRAGIVLYVGAAALAYVSTQRLFRPLTVAAFALWTPALRLFGPDPTGGLFPIALAGAAVLALVFLAAVLISRDAIDPEEQLRRVGLGLLSVACVACVVERHLVVASLSVAPDDVMALVVVATLPMIAIARLRPQTRDALATGLALATFALVGLADISGKGYHVDSVTVPHRAAELLLNGQNPYRDLDVAEAVAHFGVPDILTTHLENGTELHSLNYPALSFLSVTPFVAAGVTDNPGEWLRRIILPDITLSLFGAATKTRFICAVHQQAGQWRRIHLQPHCRGTDRGSSRLCSASRRRRNPDGCRWRCTPPVRPPRPPLRCERLAAGCPGCRTCPWGTVGPILRVPGQQLGMAGRVGRRAPCRHK